MKSLLATACTLTLLLAAASQAQAQTVVRDHRGEDRQVRQSTSTGRNPSLAPIVRDHRGDDQRVRPPRRCPHGYARAFSDQNAS